MAARARLRACIVTAIDDKVVRPLNILDDKCPDVVDRVFLHWTDVNRHGRLAVEAAWWCGSALLEMKAAVEHGDYENALFDLDIQRRTANRMTRLAREFKYDSLSHFDTVSEALKSIEAPAKAKPTKAAVDERPIETTEKPPAPRAQKWKGPVHDPRTSPANGRVGALARGCAAAREEMEKQKPPDPVAALEAALDAERSENERLQERLAIVEAELDPAKLEQIGGLLEQIRTQKKQVNSWISKHSDAQRSAKLWERKFKKLEQEHAVK